MTDTVENPLRITSSLTEELQPDRLLIKEKLLRHSRRRRQRQADNDDDDELLLLRSAHHPEHHSIDDEEDIIEEEAEEDKLEAMNHALTNHPLTWMAMRKQWQSMRRGGDGGGDGDGASGNHDTGISMTRPRTNNHNLSGHPVLLVDPSTLGYASSSYRNHRSGGGANNTQQRNSKQHSSSVMYVSRETFLKHKMLHLLYLIVSLCFIIGGIVVLEQRKLSHYALVESPISLSEYLAGEELMSKGMIDGVGVGIDDGNDNNVEGSTLATSVGGDVDLKVCGKVPTTDGLSSNIRPNPNEPLPAPSSNAGDNRFNTLKSIFVNCGVTPAPIFNNPASAQYRALQWMAYEDEVQYKPVTEYWIKKIIQRYTLVTLYYATNGEEWKNQLYFLSNRDECYWSRVYENFFSGAGYCKDGFVRALALWGNSLDGGECFNYLIYEFSVIDRKHTPILSSILL